MSAQHGSRAVTPDISPEPILSYKRTPRQPTSPSVASPKMASIESLQLLPNNSAPTDHTAQRKVLSRRRALQDFYRINPQSEGGASEPAEAAVSGESPIEPSVPEKTLPLAEELANDETYEQFVKTADIKDLLRVRNAAAEKVNLHDLKRKAIIYDNYLELIKLNQILGDINDELAEFHVNSQYIDKSLAQLRDFLETEALVFNQSFPDVVASVCASIDDLDSVASLVGLLG